MSLMAADRWPAREVVIVSSRESPYGRMDFIEGDVLNLNLVLKYMNDFTLSINHTLISDVLLGIAVMTIWSARSQA